MKIELGRETDGRWLAEAPDLPGAMAYGDTQSEAVRKVEVLVLRIMADRLEHGEDLPALDSVFAVA